MLNALIIIATFFFMEFVAWFTHKYVMHGFGWYFHKDHHVPHKHPLEKNDVFFLVFAVPSCLLMVFGITYSLDFLLMIGIGIAVYGFAYFMVHEVFIHRRLNWIKRSNNLYLRAIRKAHKVHHKNLGKEHGENFGMLIVPLKYFKEAKQAQ